MHRMDDGIWGWDGRWGTGGVRSDGQSVGLRFVDSAVLLKLTLVFWALHLTPVGFFFLKCGSLQVIFSII